jgi:hypothetical protein
LLTVSRESAAQRPPQRATIQGVRLIARSRSTSVGPTPREPTFELDSRSGAKRVVRVVSLVSIDGAQRRTHHALSPATITLIPAQSRTVALCYASAPLNDGAFRGYRFHITLEVDGQRATIESSNHYFRRIPIRR